MPVGQSVDGTLMVHEHAETGVHARTLADDVVDAKGNVVVARGADLNSILIDEIVAAGVDTVRVRSRADLRVEAGRLWCLLRPLAADR